MMDPKTIWYGEKELKDPIAIIGFPGIGLVGSIVTSFMAREFKLEMVAGITDSELPPYCLVQNGKPYPPIRVYAGSVPKRKSKKPKDQDVFVKDGAFIFKEEEPVPEETPAEETKEETTVEEQTEEKVEESKEEVDKPVEKKVKKRSKPRDVIIATSEITPKPEQMYDLVMALIDVTGKLGATEYVFLDGVPKMGNENGLIAAGTSDKSKEHLKEAGLEPLEDGLVRGVCGIALYEGFAKGLDLMAILCSANPQLPDPRSATELLLPLSLLIPRMFLDATPLFKEADEIDSRIKEQQNSQTNNQNLYG